MVDSGVYKISSESNPDRIYIGSATSFSGRWATHISLLRKGRHHSRQMQRHYDKYGEKDILFSVLLRCNKENLLMYEQRCIDVFRPFFNGSPTAGSQLGFKHSPETCEKISSAKKGCDYWTGRKHKEESKEKMRAAKVGRKLSAETRAKLSLARIGNKNAAGQTHKRGIKLSKETKRKVSEGLKRYFAAKRQQNGY